MLEAAGYPAKPGALSTVSKHIKVPASTLRGWFNRTSNPPPAKIRDEKRFDLIEALRAEIADALGAAPNARDDASYKDLITGAAILIDKLQLLTGKPTERTEHRITDEHRSQLLAGIAARLATHDPAAASGVRPDAIA